MKHKNKKLLCFLMITILSMIQTCSIYVHAEDFSTLHLGTKLPMVLTIGEDLTEEQKSLIFQYLGVELGEVSAITITNQDEKEAFEHLISNDLLGTHALIGTLVNATRNGGIHVKAVNMNCVTSDMIAGLLLTSGIYNCEVVTVAPLQISGNTALTSVMMAYEDGYGMKLDGDKKELANIELVVSTNVAEKIGQDQATLLLNDIKLNIIKRQISDEQEVYAVVDERIATIEKAIEDAAISQGKEVPQKLEEKEYSWLYDFSYKFSQIDYDYQQLRPTLERVIYNIITNTGINDSLVDMFITITVDEYEQTLPSGSILLRTNDEIWGENININSTNGDAVLYRPAEPIDVFTGDVTLTSLGKVTVEQFVEGTNVLVYKDENSSYALVDLDGYLLTEPVYKWDFQYGFEGAHIKATLNDGSEKKGILALDGTIEVDFKYDVVDVVGEMWAIGVGVTNDGTADNYDYIVGADYCLIDYVDLYFMGQQGIRCVGTLSRDEYYEAEARVDYINIQDRNDVITTYDSTFTAIQNTDSIYDFGDYDYVEKRSDIVEAKTGCSVGRFWGKYAWIRDDFEGYGIVDKYGNIIVPMQFKMDFKPIYVVDSYEAGGYFVHNDYINLSGNMITFVTEGGNVTANFTHNYNYMFNDIEFLNSGMSASLKTTDNNYFILSADGVVTDLGTEHNWVYGLTGSGGMLWEIDNEQGSYDLLDWHGNVLLSECMGYSVSANGKYIIAIEKDESFTLYLVNDATALWT